MRFSANDGILGTLSKKTLILIKIIYTICSLLNLAQARAVLSLFSGKRIKCQKHCLFIYLFIYLFVIKISGVTLANKIK